MLRAQQRASMPVVVAAAMMAVTACGATPDGSRSVSGEVLRAAAAIGAPTSDLDPCTLLAASEAAPFVGRLSTPPYRSDGERPAKNGDQCVYRGTSGREVAIKPVAHGGGVAGRAMVDIPQMLGAALAKGAPGMDTMANRVMQQAPAGPWDKATWIPGGSLMVTKGDFFVSIDVTGASGQKADAISMAKLIVPRIGHPLSYDGGAAVALAPKPAEHPSQACALVPRGAIEVAIGTLSGEPVNSDDGKTCTYTVKTNAGVRTYAVEFVWEGGRKNYNMLKHSMATLSGVTGLPAGAGLDSIPGGGQVGQMIGGLMKMATGGNRSSANGAASTVGFKTDTTLVGPWDSASLLHGTQLIAVRNDVMIGMELSSADYERAKALFAAICKRL